MFFFILVPVQIERYLKVKGQPVLIINYQLTEINCQKNRNNYILSDIIETTQPVLKKNDEFRNRKEYENMNWNVQCKCLNI